MKQVRIAQLKAQLSEHLRSVRSGQTITVLDRDTPIANIVPIKPVHKLTIIKPPPGTPALNEIPLPPPLNLPFDIVDILLEERQNHR